MNESEGEEERDKAESVRQEILADERFSAESNLAKYIARLKDDERFEKLVLFLDFENLDDRAGARSTIVTGQLPMAKWHDVIADPSVADALLDRLVKTAVKIEMKGDSLRGK